MPRHADHAPRSAPPRSFVAFGERPAASPADQLGLADGVRQPQPITERIVLRLMDKREGDRATWPHGPLASPAAAHDHVDGGGGGSGGGGGGNGNDADDEAAMPSCSLHDVLQALEAAGVRIEHSSLPNATELKKPIVLPCGGKVGSTQRARLTKAGSAIVRGIAEAVNPSGGAHTATMIAESLIPPAPLEERQLRERQR